MTGWVLAIVLGAWIAQETDPPGVLDLPRIEAVQSAERRAALERLAGGDLAAAEALLRACVKRVPHDFVAHYHLACVLARQGATAEAMASLERAIDVGFRDRDHLENDEDLARLRDEEGFRRLLAAAETPLDKTPGWTFPFEPARTADGHVLVAEKNLAWEPNLGMFRVQVAFGDTAPDAPVANGLGKAGEWLRTWYAEGTAAGNRGDLYDNHDSDHSNMNYGALPQLTRVEFSEAIRQRQLHHGLQRHFLFDAVTIGNSSTALTSGLLWRSQGRLALTQVGGAQRLYLQYRANQLYFYPEHRDHDPEPDDPGGQGHGDVFPANTPYLVLSQGSSGSDRDFLNAVAQTLAAFRPDVKQELAQSGTLMPTVQMILRSCNRNVASADDYLAPAAHPTVFEGRQLDVVRMVKMAHDMRPDALPPLVAIRVVEEEFGVPGRDYFDVGPRERLFDTPCAIARLVKSTAYWKRIVVSAEGSRDLRGRPLTFHWVTLRGDAERINIKRLNESGSIAELRVPYHERRPVTPGEALESNRVDVGVFVHNGDYYSAPAFLSFLYPAAQVRTYDEQHRIRSVDYAASSAKRPYVDPLLEIRANWRDDYRYADDGRPLGWTRLHPGGVHEEFTADGRLIAARDDQGHPSATRAVRYVAEPRPNGAPPVLVAQPVAEPADEEG